MSDLLRALALAGALLATQASADPRELLIDGPADVLAGTLLPAPPDGPAALILPGSGPTDRDGNSPLGVATDSYLLLAEALAEAGVSTLRIDKRGVGDSGGDPNAVSLAAYRADTDAWVQTLLRETRAPCVWLIGHSEGGMIALASANLPDICGLVLIATPGRPLDDILMEQLRRNPANAPHLPAFEAALQTLIEGETPELSALHPAFAAIIRPAVQDYLRELITTDTGALIAAVPSAMPVLILQGTEDLQVTEQDATRLAAARPSAVLRLLDGMSHTLKQVPAGDLAANIASYSDPALPLHPGLVPALLDLIGPPV